MGRRRAFSLLELSVALAIAGIVTAAALTTTVSLQRSMTATRVRMARGMDARAMLEVVIARVRLAGGGLVRPWQALSLSCGPDLAHPVPACEAAPHRRRLHVLELEPDGQAEIVSLSGTLVGVREVGGACPLTPERGFTAGAPVVLIPAERHLDALGGATWVTATCTIVAPCGCALGNVGLGGFNPPPAAVVPNAFVGGVLARGAPTSWFVSTASGELRQLGDVTGDGLAELVGLGPHAVAFDALFEYDDDGDGVIDRSLSTPAIGRQSALRSVRVGLAVGQPAKDARPRPARLFGDQVGAVGDVTVAVVGTAALRAAGVFQ